MNKINNILIIIAVIYIILATEIHIETDNFSFHWDGFLQKLINLYLKKKYNIQ